MPDGTMFGMNAQIKLKIGSPALHRFLCRIATVAGVLLMADGVVSTVMIVKAMAVTSENVEWADPIDALVVFFDRPGHYERVETAIEAFKAGYARNLLMVGGCRPGTGYFGALEMAKFAQKEGIATENLEVGAGSYDTRTNLEEARDMAVYKGWTSIAFVSDSLHLVRIRRSVAKDQTLAALAQERTLASPYPGGVINMIGRANHEMAFAIVSALLPPAWVNSLVRDSRIRNREAGLVICLPDTSGPLK